MNDESTIAFSRVQNFIISTAAYCVASYLLGQGSFTVFQHFKKRE